MNTEPLDDAALTEIERDGLREVSEDRRIASLMRQQRNADTLNRRADVTERLVAALAESVAREQQLREQIRQLAELYLYDEATDQPFSDAYGAFLCLADDAVPFPAVTPDDGDAPEPCPHCTSWREVEPQIFMCKRFLANMCPTVPVETTEDR